MQQSPLNRLLQTEMDRKEFLARTGAMVMVLAGIAGVIKAFTTTDTHTNSGFGSSPYGGSEDSSKPRKGL